MSAPLQTYQYSQTWGLLDEHGGAVMDKSVTVYLAADVARVFKAVGHSLGPFTSGGEWGKWKAWLVEGAPTREEGIEAARIITQCQVNTDEATRLLAELEETG